MGWGGDGAVPIALCQPGVPEDEQTVRHGERNFLPLSCYKNPKREGLGVFGAGTALRGCAGCGG